ncbi:aspartic peptidase domain-containing protein [Immersiella caudata]|uniref:Aspartic peptidase domain-containing protein n=1 Tax=Immersiella caudata TaxID=314043 RepID=A0AA40BU29_9PEZI|nr:aspartic peptidase domain-containing protein [Immersiella caudata]
MNPFDSSLCATFQQDSRLHLSTRPNILHWKLSKMSAFISLILFLHSAVGAPNTQRPLHDINLHKDNKPPKWSALPIRPARWTDMGHTVDIAIGNPPQQIPVYLDISSPNTWIVPSTLANKPCPRSPSFNATLSTTYLPTPKRADFTSGWIWGRGTMVSDTVAYGSLPAPFQPFIVANKRDGGAGGWNGCPMAGAVGLAPTGSHFARMVHMGLLEQDLFALRLREPAELSFGRTNVDLFKGEFTEIPLVRGSSVWKTTASYLVVEDGERFELNDEAATLTTATPGIHVPWGVWQGLMTALGFDDTAWVAPSVRCEKREGMANVTFNLRGRNVTLTPYDYTEFWDGLPDGPRCVSLFVTSEPGRGNSNEVVLGWAFLRAFYSVFDLGEGVVKFASLS